MGVRGNNGKLDDKGIAVGGWGGPKGVHSKLCKPKTKRTKLSRTNAKAARKREEGRNKPLQMPIVLSSPIHHAKNVNPDNIVHMPTIHFYSSQKREDYA